MCHRLSMTLPQLMDLRPRDQLRQAAFRQHWAGGADGEERDHETTAMPLRVVYQADLTPLATGLDAFVTLWQ